MIFLRLPIINPTETISAKISATVIAHQIPFMPKTIGNTKTQMLWKSSVRKNEMRSETVPLLSAVKNAEAKILNPASKNEQEKILKARTVSS